MDAKICGVKDPKTLDYIINHKHPPTFVGFICNYPKSKRYLEFFDLQNLINIQKKNSGLDNVRDRRVQTRRVHRRVLYCSCRVPERRLLV